MSCKNVPASKHRGLVGSDSQRQSTQLACSQSEACLRLWTSQQGVLKPRLLQNKVHSMVGSLGHEALELTKRLSSRGRPPSPKHLSAEFKTSSSRKQRPSPICTAADSQKTIYTWYGRTSSNRRSVSSFHVLTRFELFVSCADLLSCCLDRNTLQTIDIHVHGISTARLFE